MTRVEQHAAMVRGMDPGALERARDAAERARWHFFDESVDRVDVSYAMSPIPGPPPPVVVR